MKKIKSIIILLLLILSGFGVAGSSTFCDRRTTHDLDITIPFPSIDEYKIVYSQSGQKLELDGYNYLLDTGTPMLPSKTILITIPPGSTFQSVDFQGIGKTQISGNI